MNQTNFPNPPTGLSVDLISMIIEQSVQSVAPVSTCLAGETQWLMGSGGKWSRLLGLFRGHLFVLMVTVHSLLIKTLPQVTRTMCGKFLFLGIPGKILPEDGVRNFLFPHIAAATKILPR